MGNHLRSSSEDSDHHSSRGSRGHSTAKHKPLKPLSIRWCSQFPLTASQLKRKRDEFWDTAPAFEGRIEIWNALKVAAEFVERNDLEMAQAIVDGADIILPTGTLCDCYDRLGTRYQLPIYVLSEPTNLLPDDPEGDPHSNPDPPPSTEEDPLRSLSPAVEPTTPIRLLFAGDPSLPTVLNSRTSFLSSQNSTSANLEQSDGLTTCWPFLVCCRVSRFSGTAEGSSNRRSSFRWFPFGTNLPSKTPPTLIPHTPPILHGVNLHIRLSTGEDLTLEVPDDQIRISEAKRLLASQIQWSEDRQRWFVCGHLLPNRARLRDCNIPADFIVQVIVHSAFDSSMPKQIATPGPSVRATGEETSELLITPSSLS